MRLGIIYGGPSNEHAVSKQSGERVLKALANHSHIKAVGVFIDQNGIWHLYGMPTAVHELPLHIDMFFNALHGAYGEDGKLQTILENLKVPYIGSSPLASAMGMNKKMSKMHAKNAGLRTPQDIVIEDFRNHSDQDKAVYLKEAAQRIFLAFSPPWILKPLTGGSSLGVTIVRTRGELLPALEKLSKESGDILAEEYIIGKEASIAVVDGLRGEKMYASLPVEIVVPKGRLFDYDAKYKDEATLSIPGSFSKEEHKTLAVAAKKIHEALGLRHYSRSDFIVSPKGVYFIEVNTSPGLTTHSLLPKMLAESGVPFIEFLEHVVGIVDKK